MVLEISSGTNEKTATTHQRSRFKHLKVVLI